MFIFLFQQWLISINYVYGAKQYVWWLANIKRFNCQKRVNQMLVWLVITRKIHCIDSKNQAAKTIKTFIHHRQHYTWATFRKWILLFIFFLFSFPLIARLAFLISTKRKKEKNRNHFSCFFRIISVLNIKNAFLKFFEWKVWPLFSCYWRIVCEKKRQKKNCQNGEYSMVNQPKRIWLKIEKFVGLNRNEEMSTNIILI